MKRSMMTDKRPQEAAASNERHEKGRILGIFGNVPLYGQERGNIEVMRALQLAGYQVRIISNGKLGHLHIQPELDRNGIPWTTAPFGPRLSRRCSPGEWLNIGWGLLHTNWVLLREIVRFRPTHLYTMAPDWIDYTTPVIFLTRIPLVYRMGDRPRVSRPLFRFIWKWHAARISALGAISDFVLNTAREHGFEPTKCRTVRSCPPGGLLAQPDSQPTQVRLLVTYFADGVNKQKETVLQHEPNVLTVVYVGQLAEGKGVHLVVEAALALLSEDAQVRFLIAGDYSYNNPFALQLRERVERAMVSDRIRFLGFVTNREDVFRLADLHVCPSLCEEALGNTVLEAKRAELPSVIFARGGLSETVVHGADGWVCEVQTAKGLEAAIRFYLAHPEACVTQGKAARASVIGNHRFGVERFAREWEEVFAAARLGD
jgi:glycosyltransferase involved in cell wall biosynthesis